jgi:hypothetical protein
MKEETIAESGLKAKTNDFFSFIWDNVFRLAKSHPYVLGGIGLMMTGFILALNISFVFKQKWIYFWTLFPVAALVFSLWHFSQKINFSRKTVLFVLFSMSFGMRLLFALIVDAEPYSDFHEFLVGAKQLLDGQSNSGGEFSRFPYFSGIASYEALVMKIFGISSAKAVLMGLNCFYAAMTNILLYLIVEKITRNTRCALFSGLLYLLYPASYLWAPMLSNQQLAGFLLFSCFYIIISNDGNSVVKIIASAILLALGNAIRPYGSLFLIAIIGYFLLDIMVSFTSDSAIVSGRKKALFKLGDILLFTCVYFSCSLLLSNAVCWVNINPHGLTNRNSLWKFASGLDARGEGGWSAETAKILEIKNDEERRLAFLKLIEEHRPKSAGEWVDFEWRKNMRMWGVHDADYWVFGAKAQPKRSREWLKESYTFVNEMLKYDKAYYICLWGVLLLVLVQTMLSQGRYVRGGFWLLLIALLLYFGAHLFIEVQPRYRYAAMLLVCALADCLLFKRNDTEETCPQEPLPEGGQNS